MATFGLIQNQSKCLSVGPCYSQSTDQADPFSSSMLVEWFCVLQSGEPFTLQHRGGRGEDVPKPRTGVNLPCSSCAKLDTSIVFMDRVTQLYYPTMASSSSWLFVIMGEQAIMVEMSSDPIGLYGAAAAVPLNWAERVELKMMFIYREIVCRLWRYGKFRIACRNKMHHHLLMFFWIRFFFRGLILDFLSGPAAAPTTRFPKECGLKIPVSCEYCFPIHFRSSKCNDYSQYIDVETIMKTLDTKLMRRSSIL